MLNGKFRLMIGHRVQTKTVQTHDDRSSLSAVVDVIAGAVSSANALCVNFHTRIYEIINEFVH